jgi:hypothetical protein
VAARYTTRTGEKTQSLMLEAAFFDKSREIPPDHQRFLNIIDTDPKRSFATWQRWAGLGTLQWKPEGAPPTYDQPFELVPVTMNFFTFALAVTVTREAQLEDPENIVGMIPAELAEAEQNTKDSIYMQVFNSAFNPNVVYGYDGLPLCASNHPLGPQSTPTGFVGAYGAFSNTLGPTALTPDSVFQARLQLECMYDDRGEPDRRDQEILLVHPTQEKIAEEVIGTPKVPYSTDNTVNTEYRGLRVMSSVWLTSPYAWFVLAPKANPTKGKGHGLVVSYKWQNDFYAFYDQRTRNREMSTSFRGAHTALTWRGVVGSQGAF